MVVIFSSSAKFFIYVPKFHWRFKDYILHIARLYFAGSLVFDVQKMSVMLNHDNSVSGSPFEIPLAWLFVPKYTLSPILKDGGCLSMVFCTDLKEFSSKDFLAMAKASLWASRLSSQESGSPQNHSLGSRSWCRGKFGSLLKLGRRVFLLWQDFMSLYTWQEPEWCTYPVRQALLTQRLQGWFQVFMKTSNFLLLWGWYVAENILSIPNCFNTCSRRWFFNSMPLSDRYTWGTCGLVDTG